MTIHSRDATTNARFMPERYPNPVNTGYADALDEKNHGVPVLETDYLQRIQINHTQESLSASLAMEDEIGKALAELDATGQPTTSRVGLEECRSDVEDIREQIATDHVSYVEKRVDADRALDDFNTREGRRPLARDAFAVTLFPKAFLTACFTVFLVFGEAAIIGVWLGPFSPGGYLQASGFALAGAAGFLVLAGILGAFSLRAMTNSNATLRWTARSTGAVVIAGAKLLAFSLSAYRVHLETGRPFNLLDAFSGEGKLFVALSLGFFYLGVWKFLGGSHLPWTPYYGEASVNRRRFEALDEEDASAEFHRERVRKVYGAQHDKSEAWLKDEEEQLKTATASAIRTMRRLLGERKAVESARLVKAADIAKYQSAFRTRIPGQVFALVSLPEPDFPDAKGVINEAIRIARARFGQRENDFADFVRQLTHSQADALASLEMLFGEIRHRAESAPTNDRQEEASNVPSAEVRSEEE